MKTTIQKSLRHVFTFNSDKTNKNIEDHPMDDLMMKEINVEMVDLDDPSSIRRKSVNEIAALNMSTELAHYSKNQLLPKK